MSSLYDTESASVDSDGSDLCKVTHEVQECSEGETEADAQIRLANCRKNPGHVGFEPVKQFTKKHFPSGCQDDDLFDLTKALADLTVMVTVKFTSLERPEFLADSTEPYPCYNTRGQKIPRKGTGRVTCVDRNTQVSWDGPCPCPECEHSDTPSKKWWKVCLLTSKHVVFDDSEAKQTSCRLWFDDDKSPEVHFYGWKVDLITTDEEDGSMLFCVTHDKKVFLQLHEMWESCNSLCKTVREKYNSSRHIHNLIIIVSHPHGGPKQVSVGRWVLLEETSKFKTRYTYRISTCPGSSGAQVYRLGCIMSRHHHMGATFNGLNQSGVNFEGDF